MRKEVAKLVIHRWQGPYVENAKESTTKPPVNWFKARGNFLAWRKCFTSWLWWWLHDCTLVRGHWIVFLKSANFVVCKRYHDEADRNRRRPLLTHRPRPADPPPHANAALYLCLTHFKSCWGQGAGKFLACKSEKALEKDIFSNTGTKTAFTRGQIKWPGFRSLERELYEVNVAAAQWSCAHRTCW